MAATAACTRFSTDGDSERAAFHVGGRCSRPAAERGDLAITTDGDGVEHVDYHFRGQWFDSLGLYWREFARPGPLRERRYDSPRAARNMFQSARARHARRAACASTPGETRRVRFAITWNYPEPAAIYWFNRDCSRATPEYAGEAPTWRNYYATQWADSRAAGADAFARWDALERQTAALPRFALRFVLAGRNHRRGGEHARRFCAPRP